MCIPIDYFKGIFAICIPIDYSKGIFTMFIPIEYSKYLSRYGKCELLLFMFLLDECELFVLDDLCAIRGIKATSILYHIIYTTFLLIPP